MNKKAGHILEGEGVLEVGERQEIGEGGGAEEGQFCSSSSESVVLFEILREVWDLPEDLSSE